MDFRGKFCETVGMKIQTLFKDWFQSHAGESEHDPGKMAELAFTAGFKAGREEAAKAAEKHSSNSRGLLVDDILAVGE